MYHTACHRTDTWYTEEANRFFQRFINPQSKSSCTLHTNLHCKMNDTKIWTTTVYAHGHTTFLLTQHENTSVADKTNNPNQLWEQQTVKHNYYYTVASLSVTKLSTWRLKCYTTVALQSYRSNIISFLWCQNREVWEKVNAHMPSLIQEG